MIRLLPVYTLLLLLPLSILCQSVEQYNRSGVEKGRTGNYDEALDDLDKGISQSDAGAALVYHNIGWSYEQEGDLQNAVINYEEAIKRNPAQLISFERAGYLNYKLGQFKQAVIIGEAGMKLDPTNENIPPWLSKSYKKRHAQQQYELDDPNRDLKDFKVRQFTIGAEVTASLGLYNNDYSVRLVENPGLLLDYPYAFWAAFNSRDNWGIWLNASNPYFGSLLADTVIFNEKLESYYKLEDYYIGAGLLVSHYDGANHFGKNLQLHDYKLGFIYGFKDNKNKLDLSWYPRLIPHEAGYGNERYLDVSQLEIEWIKAYRRSFDLFFGLSLYEYYFFNNSVEVPVSDYEGTYNIKAGVIFNNNPEAFHRIHLYYTQRIYMKNYNNDNPYGSLNGQGFFGMDVDHWFKGAPFSGVSTLGQIITAKFEQHFSQNLILYQRVMLEVVMLSREKHELTLQFGIEGGF